MGENEWLGLLPCYFGQKEPLAQSLIKDCLVHQNPKVREDFIKTEDFCETAVSYLLKVAVIVTFVGCSLCA